MNVPGTSGTTFFGENNKGLLVGFVTMIISQTFVNIGAMLNILPLSGRPLVFVSHGGTALFFTLGEAGIMLSISKHLKAQT